MNATVRSLALRAVFIVCCLAPCGVCAFVMWQLAGQVDERISVQLVTASTLPDWRVAEGALRATLMWLIGLPALVWVVVCVLLTLFRAWGFGFVGNVKEARVRMDANAGTIYPEFGSAEFIVRSVALRTDPISRLARIVGRILPASLRVPALQATSALMIPESGKNDVRAFIARQCSFETLPQLLVAMLPIPLAATTIHASMTLAINAVCCGGYPPPEWIMFIEVRDSNLTAGLLQSWELLISPYTAAVAAAFIIVRVLWPGGRVNLAVSGAWAFFPGTMWLGFRLMLGWYYPSSLFDPRLWIGPFLNWPGEYPFQYFLYLLFLFDVFMYYRGQRNTVIATNGSTTCLLSGFLFNRKWNLTATLHEPPQLIRIVTRPLGSELTLKFGERTVVYSMANEREARDALVAMGVTSPPVAHRRWFLVELLTRGWWMLVIYAWLAWAYVNIVHTHVATGSLNFRVVRVLQGYDVHPVRDALKRETDLALEVQPHNDVARYYRARLFEDEGKIDEAATMYRQLARVPWKTLREARAASPSPWWLPIRGQKIRNACNERLMKMGARQ